MKTLRKTLALAATSLIAGSAANAALIVHYDFENSDATNLGTGPNGVVNGGSTFVPSTAGPIAGTAWSGNRAGANDAYIATGLTGTALGMGSATSAYTAMAWVLWDGGVAGTTGDHMVFGQDDGAGNNAQLHHGIRDDSAANVHFGGWGGDQDIGDAGTVPTSTWTHVAWQYDPAGVGEAVVYVNGVEITRQDKNNITSPALNVIVGAHGRDSNLDPAPGNSFNGLLDEVRIYDEVLTLAEINTAMNAVVPEPSVFALAGLAGLGLIARRRRRS